MNSISIARVAKRVVRTSFNMAVELVSEVLPSRSSEFKYRIIARVKNMR